MLVISNFTQGVNDALGIGAAPGGQASWGAPMGAAPGDFGEAAKIWSDPHLDQQQQQFNPMHGHHLWAPNGGMMGGPPVGKQAMPWDQQRITGIPRGGMGRGGPTGGRYPPGGMDMSVPPPIDLPLSGMSGMRQMAPPNAAGAWKPEISVAPNGIRGPAAFGQMAAPLIMSGKPQAAPSQFPIGGVDDLMWHDPNGDLKKWQRDTGVSLWGDPEKNNERPVRLWMIGEGEEEDLEVALMKCPVPQKKVDGSNEDGSARLPFPVPPKRPIVVTGWGELPENDPNNPIKHDDVQPGSGKWGDLPSHSQHSTDSPWFLPSQQQPQPFAPEAPAWGQPNAATAPLPPGPSQPHTQAVADQLKYAVDKGYLDMSVLQQTNLPPHVLQHMNQMLALIPALECCEAELKLLVDSVRPDGEVDGNSPQRWMNDVQKVEYNRLIIEVTTVKIEVAELSKKIQRGLADAGMPSGSAPVEGLGSDAYHYSFLE
uniref:PCI domain-containing protein n=1 Tax=Angiostrongylus cantonensis TaxID=6313 RepID=A0A0K0D4C8_ANGCA